MTSQISITVPGVRHAPLDTSALTEKLCINHLNFYYGAVQALKDVCLTLYANKVTAIIGPSGCGKSTLLRVLNRILRALCQSACRRPGHAGRQEYLARQPGSEFTAIEGRDGLSGNRPRFQCRFTTISRLRSRHTPSCAVSDLDTRVETALRRAAIWDEVKDVLTSSALSLSGGQQQRLLCIARALAERPEVILFDEPCSALDPLSTAKIEDLIGDLEARPYDRDRDA